MFPSYRNQSVDLLRKSMTRFYMMGTLIVKGLSKTYINSLGKPKIIKYKKQNINIRKFISS